MIKLTNIEIIIIISIFLFQRVINPLYLLIPVVGFLGYNVFNNKKEVIKNINIDDIVQSHFKNTIVNKSIYSLLLSNVSLIDFLKKIELFKNLDTATYRSIIYELWAFLKAYVFYMKKKALTPSSINEIIEKRNKVLNSINTLTFQVDGKNSASYIQDLVILSQTQMNNYIDNLRKKFNIAYSEQPISNDVLSAHTIF